MARQCPACNKLCALETQEPEDVELEIAGCTVKMTARLVRNSECCGEEMKEASFEPEEELDPQLFKGHVDENGEPLKGHMLEIEAGDAELTDRCEGKGRGTRTFYGVTVSYSVTCSCQDAGANSLFEGSISDECQASSMEELT